MKRSTKPPLLFVDMRCPSTIIVKDVESRFDEAWHKLSMWKKIFVYGKSGKTGMFLAMAMDSINDYLDKAWVENNLFELKKYKSTPSKNVDTKLTRLIDETLIKYGVYEDFHKPKKTSNNDRRVKKTKRSK